MASIYSTRAVADRIDYVTTKTAILGMTRAVAIETATSGITCNALCPGTLPTPAIQGKIASIAAREGRTIDETTRDYLAARQPTGRFVAMEGVGAMAVFLCSPAATGHHRRDAADRRGLVHRMSVIGRPIRRSAMAEASSRNAVVTGAAGGMGRAITKALLESGRRVVLVDRDAEVAS